MSRPLPAQQTGTVTGLVTDATSGDAIPGAQISIPGTGLGVLANNVGRYVLLNIPAGSLVVRAQLIGYSREDIAVEVPPGGTALVNFELRREAISLEGVVVTGTAGIARRREIGNSVAQINRTQLDNTLLLEGADALMGRAPGVTVQMNSGQVGVGSSIRLRGNNSIQMGNNPLIFIDGVAVRSYGTQYQDEAGHSSAPLTDLNPDDIERIEVIKGAAASTLYGSDAAGGAIQIFTKRGVPGAAAWSAGVDMGVNTMGHVGHPDIKNGLWMNDCTDLGETACPYGDWLANGMVQRYTLSVRGGTQTANYFLSGHWADERGVIDNGGYGDDEGEQRYSLRANFGFAPRPDLSFQFNTSFIHKDTRWFPDGNNAEGLLLNVMRGGAGNTPDGEDGLTLGMKLNTLTDHFTTGVNAVWIPMEGLTHMVNAGLDWNQNDYQEEKPYEYWYDPLGEREVDQYLTRLMTFSYSGTWESDLFSGLSSQLAWGGLVYDIYSLDLNSFGEDFSGPGDKEIDSAARTEAFETRRNISNGGVFLQEMVGWNGRLFITGGVRVDGHSAFGKDVGWAFYPKLSAAYMISDHDFFPERWGTLKLRAALGESGKAPGVFDAVRTWDAVPGDEGRPGVTPDNLGNPDLGPERTREIEGGFEGSTFGGRLTFEYTYYHQKTTDALIGVQQRPSGGFVGTQMENVGEVENRGHEVGIHFTALDLQDLVWDLDANVSTNRSEVISLGGLDRLGLGWRNEARPGHALPEFCHRVVQNGDAVGEVPIIGGIECLGPVYPTHTFGIVSSLTLFRRLNLSLVGEGQGGHTLNAAALYQNTRRFVNPLCYDVQDKLRNGDTADLSTYQWALCSRAYTTYGMWAQDADFFRLRSASLSYRLPEEWLPGSIRGATIRLQGRNLLTITDYQGIDPEVSEDGIDAIYRQGYYHLPAYRTFILSLKVDF